MIPPAGFPARGFAFLGSVCPRSMILDEFLSRQATSSGRVGQFLIPSALLPQYLVAHQLETVLAEIVGPFDADTAETASCDTRSVGMQVHIEPGRCGRDA